MHLCMYVCVYICMTCMHANVYFYNVLMDVCFNACLVTFNMGTWMFRQNNTCITIGHQLILHTDDNMKDMPVATVKPTVRSELAGARTSGRGSRVRQGGAATDAAGSEHGQRLEPPTTNAAGREHRQRMEPSSSGAARQRLDPSSSRMSEIPPLTARANPFTTMSNPLTPRSNQRTARSDPLTARSNQLTARSNRITGKNASC